MKGTLFIIPIPISEVAPEKVLSKHTMEKASSLRCFVVEKIKTARRFLRSVDREFPIDDCEFSILNKRNEELDFYHYVLPAMKGHDLGVMSDAGCPGVADPGAAIVNIAHDKGIRVHPFVGPSSILLALMGSGFSGQQFTFHGYLPKERKARIAVLKRLEADTRKTRVTHLFMDTPFRNMNVLDDLLNVLSDPTMVSIASNITLPSQDIRTMSVKNWREKAYDLSKKPAIFSIGTVVQ